MAFWFKLQNTFSTWLLGRHSGIFDQNDFNYFLSTSHPYTSYQVNGPFYSGEEVQNRFLRCQLWRPIHSDSFYQEKNRIIDFQDSGHVGHLGFQIGMTIAIFYPQVP